MAMGTPARGSRAPALICSSTRAAAARARSAWMRITALRVSARQRARARSTSMRADWPPLTAAAMARAVVIAGAGIDFGISEASFIITDLCPLTDRSPNG
jgi:hypothetical protein